MHTVKRLEKNTILDRTEISTGRIRAAGHKVYSRCYAVIDESGEVVKSANGYEIYQRKATAQRVADWYNERSTK